MSGAGAASQRSTPQKGALKGQPHLPLEDVKGLKAKTLANPCIEGFKWVSSASKHDSWGVMMEATRNHTSENQPRTPSGVGLIQPDFLPLSKGQKVRVPPPAPPSSRFAPVVVTVHCGQYELPFLCGMCRASCSPRFIFRSGCATRAPVGNSGVPSRPRSRNQATRPVWTTSGTITGLTP